MECIYYENLSSREKIFEITGDEARHIRALNLRTDELIMVTNGKGLNAACRYERTGKYNHKLEAIEYHKNHNELPFRLGVAMGILDSRDRLEFALEKTTELGATDFYPLITEFTQKSKINPERLKSKALAALKQCKRSVLPVIHDPVILRNAVKYFDEFDDILLLQEDGGTPSINKKMRDTVVVIGPEGGFSSSETEEMKAIDKCISWSLGSRRLRAETAAVLAAGLVSLRSV